MTTSIAIAMSVTLPPPMRNVVSVAELAAQPGQKFGITAARDEHQAPRLP